MQKGIVLSGVLLLSAIEFIVSRTLVQGAAAVDELTRWKWTLDAFDIDNSGNNTFRILGGTALSRPCCMTAGNGIVHCFIRNSGSFVEHMVITKEGAKKWTTLNSHMIIDEIECVIAEQNQLTLIALDENSAIMTNRHEKEWEGWKWRSGVLVEVPSCVARNKEINCVHRRFGNSGFRTDEIEGDWEWNYRIGGVFTSPLKCISIDEMRFDCFGATAPKRILYHRHYDANEEEWVNEWEARGGYAIGRPSTTSWGADRIDVFYIGSGNSVKHVTYDGEWKPEETLDASKHFDTSPECVATAVNRIHCFAIGDHSALYRNSFDGSTWSGWMLEFGTFLETPVCVVPVKGKDEVACYMRSYKLELVEKYFTF